MNKMDYIQTHFSEEERAKLLSFKNIIVWGYPLHTHTQSYIHASWVKAFSALRDNVFWFTDENHPSNDTFDYSNSIFIAEGYADINIPINESSVYFINFAIHPEKYINKGARIIDIRLAVDEINDVNISWKKEGRNIISLSDFTQYEKLENNEDVNSRHRGDVISPMKYECIYLYWATDLLPHEFNYESVNKIREKKIYYIGSSYETQNYSCFKNCAEQHGIEWIKSDPWSTPISFEENRRLIENSFLAPDFRPTGTDGDVATFGFKNGKNHLAIGLVPCRIFKNISYGQVGITDSAGIKAFCKEHVEYDEDMSILFDKASEQSTNIEKIKKSMKWVEENHTYIHRVRDLIRAIMM